jgi:N-acylglucosamine 2-epimerase
MSPTEAPLSDARIATLAETYRTGLLEDIVPFWLRHGMDAEHGGIMTCLDRNGSLIDTDKGLWQQGRFGWLMGTLYHSVEPNEAWFRAAESVIGFVRQHGFSDDGQMYFQVTRDGKPLRKRRYVFSESFASIAMANWARMADSDEAAAESIRLFEQFVDYNTTVGKIAPKVDPNTRPGQGIGPNMILINSCQVLRDTVGYARAEHYIDQSIERIERYFVKPELKVVMETVGPDGEIIDHMDGRLLNPGHAIEAAWFILHEAHYRNNDTRLRELGCTMLDWMWKWGWDEEFGGIQYFRDVKGKPPHEYWHDMKFWWPQNEAIIATLLAYALTGDEKYAQWHTLAHDWAHEHFPDKEHGEWFGYLHRDGRLSTPLKGNMWKGPFHAPRMQWYCWSLCEAMLGREDGQDPPPCIGY